MEYGAAVDIFDTARLLMSFEPVVSTDQQNCARTPAARCLLVGSGEVTRHAHYPGRGAAFFAPDFELRDPRPWHVPERCVVVDVPVAPSPTTVRWETNAPCLDSDIVQADVRYALEGIRRGEWQKVVPVWFSRRAGTFSPDERCALVRNAVAAASPGRWAYGLTTPDDGVVGVTPEVLFRVDPRGVVHTMALAGTQRIADGGTSDDLLNDPKERAEHRWVIDFLSSRLAPLGDVAQGETRTIVCGALRHIYTPFTVCPSRRREFIELVELFHPTPALGAVPSEPGLAWLRERESHHPRVRHGAPFGVIAPNGEMVCLVAIRNVQWTGAERAIGAGCGIVAGTDAEREFREACAKVESVQTMLGLGS